jgi:hypothetical protein
MASQRQLSQGPMPSQPQRDSDDDFGLSSADEADMLKAEDQTSSQVQLRPTMPRSPMPNTAAGPSYHPAVGWYYPVVADNVRKRRSEENLHNPAKALKIDDGSALTYLAQKALQEKFGLNQFQLKQKQVIDRLLSGGSAVVVFPTGMIPYQVLLNRTLVPNTQNRWRQEPLLPGSCSELQRPGQVESLPPRW